MNIVLLGAPGAGKGTQAQRIVDKYAIVHIATGDIFRKNIKEMTPLGAKVKQYLDSGSLVPDTLTVELVSTRLGQDDCKGGFMLDGFPRNVAQAIALDAITPIDKVVNIDVDLGALADRLTGRRVCLSCGRSYHISTMTGDMCMCGQAIVQRDDDKIETVTNRLKVYEEQTKPLIAYYRSTNKLVDVDGMQEIDRVFADIVQIIDKG